MPDAGSMSVVVAVLSGVWQRPPGGQRGRFLAEHQHMPVSDNPIRPLQRSLQSVFRRLADPRLLMPFLLLALLKVALLSSVARFDLLPSHLISLLLWAFPHGVVLLHYPETLEKLPELARWLDRAVFVSVGALVHGWAILYLARLWTRAPLVLFPSFLVGLQRMMALAILAGLVLGIPYGVQWVVLRFDHSLATVAALAAGFLVQMMLFVAPAFLVIEGRSLWQSLRLSLQVVGEYPLVMPLVVVVLATLHAPALALRMPAFLNLVALDPDRILYALLAQIPIDLLGAMLAAGLASRLALTFRSRRPST